MTCRAMCVGVYKCRTNDKLRREQGRTLWFLIDDVIENLVIFHRLTIGVT